MNRATRLAVLIAISCVAGAVRSDGADQDFCQHESSVVRNFCTPLKRLRESAQARGSGETDANFLSRLQSDLNQVNPLSPSTSQGIAEALSAELAGRVDLSKVASQIAPSLSVANLLRPDQQLSSGNTAAGTTSLVTKAGSASLLGLALDTGALTRSVNGTTATLSANADQLYRTITKADPLCPMNCNRQNGLDAALNSLNFTASFALAQATPTTTATTGQASGPSAVSVPTTQVPTGEGKLTSFTAKYVILNKFDVRKGSFNKAWQAQAQKLAAQAAAPAAAIFKVRAALESGAASKEQAGNRSKFDQELADAASKADNGAALAAKFLQIWAVVVEASISDAKFQQLVTDATRQLATFGSSWRDAVQGASKALLSAQYTYNKPLNQPRTHDVTLILGTATENQGNVTFNGSLSLYDGALPVGAKYGRLHYGQASAQYDRALSGQDSSQQWTFNLAGYWQYQPEPSVLNIPAGTTAPGTSIPVPNGTQVFVGTAGSLWVAQGGVTFKASGGINVPFAVSWSNKTDLLQGQRVGAQVGISYNFASLSKLF